VPDLNTPFAELSPDDQLAYLQSQIDALATVASTAKQLGDRATLAWALLHYRELSAQAYQLRQQANARGYPAGFLVALDHVSDVATQVGKETLGLAEDFGRGAVGILHWLPWLVVGLLLVVGIAFYRRMLHVRV
jgi:hypothetical protein